MPRMSKKRKHELSFYLNDRGRVTYNELCRKCMSFPFTSMTGGVSLTTNYAGNASMGASRASGRLWLTAPVIYPNEQRKRRNTPNEF